MIHEVTKDGETPASGISKAQIHIAVCGSRFDRPFKNKTMRIGELAARLGRPTRTQETLSEYLHMSKPVQDDIKDVGGYVGGLLRDGVRSTRNVSNRSIVTLDLDNAGDSKLCDIMAAIADATPGAAYVVHSTHKHREGCCRLRYVGFLSRPVFSDEYQAVARKIASMSNIEWFDDTTYEPARLMYWPSVSMDADFVYVNTLEDGDATLIDVDAVLATYGQDDAWKDSTLWPTSSRQQTVILREMGRQQNPLEKGGLVGAFCRVYDIHSAVESYLSDIYRRDGNRYTYLEGSTAKGVAVYGMDRDDTRALWVYSNHATDPANGMLCNAFDICRVHKFGVMDDRSKPDTPTHKLPSYKAMLDFAKGIKAVVVEEALTLFPDDGEDDHAETLFAEMGVLKEEAPKTDEPRDDTWKIKLLRNKDNSVAGNFPNACEFIEHDENLSGLVWYNEFSGQLEHMKKRAWCDEDTSSVRKYLAGKYEITFSKNDTQDAIDYIGFKKRNYHPVKEYLQSVNGTWDGVPRAERLWIDYLGEEDNAFTREAARCWLMAACTRIWEPGYKFDNVPVISGAQGAGKSTMCRVMAKGWFGELASFDDQKAVEQMRLCWIMELAEMAANNRHEIEEQKRFISAKSSRVRLAYRRNSAEYKRQCVFIGTTNQSEYLKDHTGNRRWWPLICHLPMIDTRRLKSEMDQIWAEVMDLCADPDATTELSNEARVIAMSRQQDTMVTDSWEGIIAEWLSLPANKHRYDQDWSEAANALPGEAGMERRDRVCVQEIWQDCLGGRKTDLKKVDANRIGAIVDKLAEWNRVSTCRFGVRFGRQKGWLFRYSDVPF